ncbi:MAG: MFS transporter, partial [Actinomycetota bacterium]|nr:MFS transporter [Actinomycetota bacterium]
MAAQAVLSVEVSRSPLSAQGPVTAGGRAVPYGEVLAVREFRAVFSAQVLSLLGDRAAAVALAVLVYDRSGSPLLSASVFALTFLPHLCAAPLATFVDRLPRRTVLVACDLARLPLVLAMLVPGLPIPVLLALLGLVTLFEVPYDAARAVVTRAVLDDDQYPVGNALASALHQASLLVGSLGGGLLIAATSVQGCLLINAATFGVSAVLARARLAPHPPRAE